MLYWKCGKRKLMFELSFIAESDEKTQSPVPR